MGYKFNPFTGTLDESAPVGAGATTFVELTDTPANYTGSAGLFAKVNAGATALEFAAGAGGDTLPVVDTTGIAKGSVDATKIVRFEVDGLTTATTRVLTVPDADITLESTTGSQAKVDTHNAIVATASVPGHATATQITKLDGIAPSANNYAHPNHSGDVTSVADGAQTIAANAVTNAKAAQMATKTYKGRTTAATGNAEDVPVATVKADLVLVKADVGLGNVENLKVKLDGTATPAAAIDDVTLGYTVGSRWFDVTNDKEYVCLDNTDGAAVWTETTGAGVRTTTITSSATPTPNVDITDIYTITALAEAATFGAPTGTLVNGKKLIIRIKDNATARALAWNAIYRAGTAVSLPSTTTVSKTLYCGFMYNSTDSKWDLLAVTTGF